MKWLPVIILMFASCAMLLSYGCDDKKDDGYAAQAKIAGAAMSTVFRQNGTDDSDTAFGRNPLEFSDPEQVSAAGFDTEALGLGDFSDTGGFDQQAVQTRQLETGYEAMQDSPESDNGTVFNADGTRTDFDITWDSGNVTITMTTSNFAAFIDNVTASLSIATMGTPDNSEDDVIRSFSYTVYLVCGTVMDVTAIDTDNNGNVHESNQVTLQASVTNLPALTFVTSVIDRFTVDTNGTLGIENDDEVIAWSRNAYYSNGMHQCFELLDNGGHIVSDGIIHIDILTDSFPADTAVDEVADDIIICLNDADNGSDDSLLYWERVVTFTNTSAVLTIATEDYDNDGHIIENGVVEFVITGDDIPDENNPGEYLTVTEYIKIDTKETLVGTDDEVLAFELTVSSTDGGTITFDFADTDGDGTLTYGTTTATLGFYPADGVGLSDSILISVAVEPQGNSDPSDDLIASWTLTDNRRNGSEAEFSITATPAFLPGTQPSSATFAYTETYYNGNPKIDGSITFLSDQSGSGTITFYTLGGTAYTFNVTVSTAGVVTVEEA